MSRTALITGITGQDGCYLCKHLLELGYIVHGWTRDSNSLRVKRLKSFLKENISVSDQSKLHLHSVPEMTSTRVEEFLKSHRPHEIYHLAAQSHVGNSFADPRQTYELNTLAVLELLEGIRSSLMTDSVRFFLAGSAAVFEGTQESPQTERTVLAPRSPYGCSKANAQLLVSTYREAYGLFACTGILYNHESPLRTEQFVTGKIVDAAARISLGIQQELTLGNIDTGRDWGFAGDYVKAMRLMLQHEIPEDFIIATGQWHPLRELLSIAFETVNLDWTDFTRSDPAFSRPTEPTKLVGDSTCIQRKLLWTPEVTFEECIRMMVESRVSSIRN